MCTTINLSLRSINYEYYNWWLLRVVRSVWRVCNLLHRLTINKTKMLCSLKHFIILEIFTQSSPRKNQCLCNLNRNFHPHYLVSLPINLCSLRSQSLLSQKLNHVIDRAAPAAIIVARGPNFSFKFQVKIRRWEEIAFLSHAEGASLSSPVAFEENCHMKSIDNPYPTNGICGHFTSDFLILKVRRCLKSLPSHAVAQCLPSKNWIIFLLNVYSDSKNGHKSACANILIQLIVSSDTQKIHRTVKE